MDDLRQKYTELYEHMAMSKKPEYMKTFGKVMTEMFDWFAVNKPNAAQEWIEKLESIKWKNYLTPAEAEDIVSEMNPKTPWSREQWRNTMERHGFDLEREPCYNRCALWVTMSMIMSDSSSTLEKYIDEEQMFKAVYDLAVDKLTDKDGKFNIRHYFSI